MADLFTGDYLSDLSILLEEIKDIRYIGSTDRRKIGKINKKSFSVLYGLTYKKPPNIYKKKDADSNYYHSVCRTEYPHLLEFFIQFSRQHFPGLLWDSVQINMNFKCLKHRDKKNNGRSALVTLGDFEGGKTLIEIKDTILKLDGRDFPIIFNGNKYYHWVEDYTGVRYSLVFFQNFIGQRPLYMKLNKV